VYRYTTNKFDKKNSVCMYIHVGVHVTGSNCIYLSPNKRNKPAFLACCLIFFLTEGIPALFLETKHNDFQPFQLFQFRAAYSKRAR
jgi:hypothetical protein